MVTAKITSDPPYVYVLAGEGPIHLNCINASENNMFYNDVLDAIWYRFFNGTRHKVEDTGQVFADTHFLTFHPSVREIDQGQYMCCTPNTSALLEMCSAPANVSIVGMYA